MFANTQVVNLFPVPVWVHGLEQPDAEAAGTGLRQAIDKAWGREGQPGDGAAWQTPADLQDQAEAAVLVGAVQAAAKGVLDHLTVTQEAFLIAGMQAEIAPPGTTSPARGTAEGAFLSGLYTLQGEGGATVVFHDPRPQGTARPRYAKATEYNARHANLGLQPGTLVLYPAGLRLELPANGGGRERITVGFDITLLE